MKNTIIYGGHSPNGCLGMGINLERFDVKPPIKNGDLYNLIDRKYDPGLVIISDGIFGNQLPITPLEVMDLSRVGWLILGTSSMGALRALDCSFGGVVGIGKVYHGFRFGIFSDDSAVAALYDPVTLSQVTVPTVQIYFILKELFKSDPAKFRSLYDHLSKIMWFDRYHDIVSQEILNSLNYRTTEHEIQELINNPKNDIKCQDLVEAINLCNSFLN